MARHRRGQPENKQDKSTNSSSSNGSNSSKQSKQKNNLLSYWKMIMGCTCLMVAVCVGYLGYLETRVNTPYDDKKMVSTTGLDVPERFWGSYRSGVYFGLKSRDPQSILTGLMWYFPNRLQPGGHGVRHWCEQGDGLDKYGWTQHDGTTFGVQEIHDGPFLISTSFVKRLGGSHGGDWSGRISVNYKKPNINLNEEVSLLWYTALDENSKGFIKASNSGSRITGVRGETPTLGEFSIKLFNHSGSVNYESFLSTNYLSLALLKETVISSLRFVADINQIVLAGELSQHNDKNPDFIVTQVTAKVPFTLDVVFESGSFGTRQNTLVGDTYTEALNWHLSRFHQRFEDTYKLKEKGYSPKDVSFAQAALSNMIGGIGYFYGSSKVQSSYTKEPVPYWKAPLYTAVPSRSFFPRGFVWDEGFHGYLISTWDLDVELDIICHWFDLMNVEGWIPREQILGTEAIAKVPKEFITQKNTNANPPTFFLTLQFILSKFENQLTDQRLEVLERLYPRLQAWFSWFNQTQKGNVPGSYRWQGRDSKTDRELNPKTLTSGLDDYPRASHPTEQEMHVDLRCWIAMAASTLARLADVLGRDGYRYEQTAEYLMNNDLLNELHWSSYAGQYADYGYHTDSVELRRPKISPRTQQSQSMEMIRVTTKKPELRLVDSSFGYVSLFPFLLHILEPDSPKLKKILDDLNDPNLLWTEFGLRSLARNSPLYMKRNTEHDPPYWRGQIWINLNYLAVRALYHYKSVDGPFKVQAGEMYEKLRSNVIRNVINQYFKSGYLWEQYNDRTGEGSGCRPFTGWSALVVLMMSEQY
ncbi:mannosyl-oligosaccharide glucosidase [Onthophagus taurus]|uniref:mannosyl-oligosaccharide glucosidase n=1 Tax=Onthophagus taurus TaxID=166361 RepID=UPI0039BE6E85